MTQIDRRTFIAGAGLAALGSMRPLAAAAAEVMTGAAAAAPKFNFEDVIDLARQRATKDYAPSDMRLKPPFDNLSYDAFRNIRYRRDVRLFRPDRKAFSIDLLPPGLVYTQPVQISLVRDGQVMNVPFSAGFFDFGAESGFADGRAPDGAGAGLAFSGFRLRNPFNSPDSMDEFTVFQGASYFRAVARNLIYGLSARALAIGTADPKGEEFPLFKHFWVYEPAPDDRRIRVQALLDSPSIAGAYEFDIQPGETTTMDTRSRLFPRRTISQIGVAPLTSMYFFGPARRTGRDDFRDAVHDSGALQMIHGSGRRLLRPLSNPSRVRVSAFQDENPKGFGLTQRRRDFGFYQDAEARYEKRPSAWIEPFGNWGSGQIMLVEIPVQDEFNDNIVAFWRPRAPLEPSAEGHAFEYRLHWCAEPPDAAPLARVHATRSGRSINAPDKRIMVVDFRLGELPQANLKPVLWSSGGDPSAPTLRALPGGELTRIAFEFTPGRTEVLEFQLKLAGPDADASETWMYQWPAP